MKKKLLLLWCYLLTGTLWLPAQTAGFLREIGQLIEAGHYEEAIPLLEKNMGSLTTLDPTDARYYLTYLSRSYIFKNPVEAEKAFMRAIRVVEESHKKCSKVYSDAVHALAWDFFDFGNPAKALRYYEELLRCDTSNLPIEDKVVLYERLAKLYRAVGENEKAEEFYKRMMGIFRLYYYGRIGSFHDLRLLMDAADFYSQIGKYQQADTLFRETLGVLQRGDLGEDEQFILLELSMTYVRHGLKMGNMECCDTVLYPYLDSIYELCQQNPSGFYVANWNVHIFMTLSRYYYIKKEYDKSVNLAIRANAFYRSQMNNNALLLNEELRELFWRELEPVYALLNSIAIHRPLPELAQICYDNQLTNKSILLQSNRKIREYIRSSPDTALQKSYDAYVALRRQLVDSLVSIQPEAPTHLTEYIDRLEATILQAVPTELKVYEQPVSWEDIQRRLKDDEAAIEFVCFEETGADSPKNSTLTALLIRKGATSPQFVHLGSQGHIAALLEQVPSNSREGINALYNSTGLYDLIWKPLEKQLSGVRRVYFSTSGILNRVAFHAIGEDETGWLKNRYDLYQLSSTRLLAEDTIDRPVERKDAVLFGQMEYGQGGPYPRLNDTRETGSFVLHCRTNRLSFQEYYGVQATETAWKQLDGRSPSILFLSTHGVYLPLSSRVSFLPQDSSLLSRFPMLRSVLLFSGANESWDGSKLLGKENNILQASEIAEMDLSNTDLVVLSACESALGDLNNNEGVLGVQRAFKLAGCRTLLMTLWQVPEERAQFFMEEFSKALLAGKQTKHEAFRSAQEKLKGYEQYPYDWAGFVMID